MTDVQSHRQGLSCSLGIPRTSPVGAKTTTKVLLPITMARMNTTQDRQHERPMIPSTRYAVAAPAPRKPQKFINVHGTLYMQHSRTFIEKPKRPRNPYFSRERDGTSSQLSPPCGDQVYFTCFRCDLTATGHRVR